MMITSGENGFVTVWSLGSGKLGESSAIKTKAKKKDRKSKPY